MFSSDPFALGGDSQFYFNVVIIYDQRDSAIRAKAIFDRLMARYAGEFHFQCDFWRFDVLEMPEAQQQASWAGQVADLIIIASQSGEVSQAVKEWLAKCVSEKPGTPSALVELFSDSVTPESVQSDMREFLKPFATGVDFLVHEIEAPRSRVHAQEEALLSPPIRWSPPSRGWGINE